MLTFGQYNALVAIRNHPTSDQLVSQTAYDQLIVNYYITMLLTNGLIIASDGNNDANTLYTLTNMGAKCIAEYESSNPELTLTRATNHLKFN